MVEAATPEIDALRAGLEAARAELLASLAGITQVEFEHLPAEGAADEDGHRPVRDLLWHIGLVEDWYRRTIGQAVGGRPVDPFQHHPRPQRLATPEYLLAWVDQTRRPLLSLLRRLSDADMATAIRLPDGRVLTPREVLAYVAAHDREHAGQVRALRAAAPAER